MATLAINLQKGQKIDLKKSDGSALTKVVIGLGWKTRGAGGGFLSSLFGGSDAEYDLDASVFLCRDGKLTDSGDIVYYGHLKHASGAVVHHGDNLVGGDGVEDDEQITVDLQRVPSEYDRLVFVVNIYKCRSRSQHFGQVHDAFMRVVDDRGAEFCRYNLTEKLDGQTAMVFGEVYRRNGEWRFSAVGQGTNDESIDDLARRFK